MKWILIYWLLQPGGMVPATGTAVFDDQPACQAAADGLLKDWAPDYNNRHAGQCFASGSVEAPKVAVPTSVDPGFGVVVAPPSGPTYATGPSRAVAPPSANPR